MIPFLKEQQLLDDMRNVHTRYTGYMNSLKRSEEKEFDEKEAQLQLENEKPAPVEGETEKEIAENDDDGRLTEDTIDSRIDEKLKGSFASAISTSQLLVGSANDEK